MDHSHEMPPVKIAFILDDQVVDILHTDNRLASIFLSEPVIVDVTGEDGNSIAQVGDNYDAKTNTFTKA